jgi:ADP-ribosyl-[dinitrogen reductase] hydrolase
VGALSPSWTWLGAESSVFTPGEWTDDTSMALCLADSLLACGGFDPADQMARYWRWGEEGYRSVRPHPIGMGKNVVQAMRRWRKTGEPYCGSPDPKTSGNGCLMRLAPVSIFFQQNLEAAIHYGRLSAATTHGSEDCLAATGLFAELLVRALRGAPSKAEALIG